jgi:hypothetical protein
MIALDLSALDGLMLAGYPLSTLLVWLVIAGVVCLALGIVVHLVFENGLLLCIGAGCLISAGATYLVNVL